MTTPTTATAEPVFDAARPWRLHPQVALRPEPFGAMLYHFGTRRLTFLKTPTLVELVRDLGERASAEEACQASGVGGSAAYRKALAGLAATQMIIPADEAESPREPNGAQS